MPPPADPVADSVRLAWPAEAGAIAAIQRRGWAALPSDLATPLLEGLDEPAMTEAWGQVLVRPADARQRVLVAVAGDGRVVGFATTGPSSDPDADAVRDGELDQFWIDPPAQRRGHGSRLLNAAADTLRADGFTRGRWWVLRADIAMRRFLAVAGWETDGARRTIGPDDGAGGDDTGVRIEQLRLHTDLGEAPASPSG